MNFCKLYIKNISKPCSIRGTDYTIITIVSLIVAFKVLGWKVMLPIMLANFILNVCGSRLNRQEVNELSPLLKQLQDVLK